MGFLISFDTVVCGVSESNHRRDKEMTYLDWLIRRLAILKADNVIEFPLTIEMIERHIKNKKRP
tara:strand:- start:90 stop:281 length:192 start_codon:yes stop_codon:yes gene_type:complete